VKTLIEKAGGYDGDVEDGFSFGEGRWQNLLEMDKVVWIFEIGKL